MCLDSGARNLYVCISALHCVKMRSNRYYKYYKRSLFKIASVICINGGDRNLLRDQEPYRVLR